jgi:RHS repeat-associated protein
MKYLKYTIFVLLIFAFMCIQKDLQGQPTASSIESDKLDQVVGEFTGALNVNLPLGTISNGSLSAGLTLIYAGNGLRPQELSSPAGLGWVLSSGYLISRQVQGKADEMTSTYNTVCCGSPEEYANGTIDGEFDIFRLNLPGFSGEFVREVDASGQFLGYKTLETSEIKIVYNQSNNSFSVKTVDGTTMVFIPGSWRATFNGSGVPTYHEITSWVPQHVISYDLKDTLYFDYLSDITYKYTTINNEVVGQKIKRIDKLKGNNDYLELEWGFRNDTDASWNTLAYKINAVKYASDTYCLKYVFNSDYFNYIDNPGGNNGTQIRLKGIQKYSCDNTEFELPTSFEYHGTVFTYGTQFAPQKNVTGIDHWGYYNGANSNSSTNLLPSPNGSATRTPSLGQTLETQLKAVTTPLGKRTEYEYQLNTYNSSSTTPNMVGPVWTCDPVMNNCLGYNENNLSPVTISSQDMLNGNLSIYLDPVGSNGSDVTVSISSSAGNYGGISFNAYSGPNIFTVSISDILNQNNQPLFVLNQTYYISVESNDGHGGVYYSYYNTNITNNGGGLRVSKVTTIHHTNTSNTFHDITEYTYEKGKLLSPPNNTINYQNKYYNVIGDVKALNFISGVNIGYERVTTSKSQMGKTIKLFNTNFAIIDLNGWRRITDVQIGGFGNLLSTKIYGSNGVLISKDSIEYLSGSNVDVLNINRLQKKGLTSCNGTNCNVYTVLNYIYGNYKQRISKQYSYYLDSINPVSTTVYDYGHSYSLQPKLITSTTGNGLETSQYIDYTPNLWSNSNIKNQFLAEGINVTFLTNQYINGILSGGKRTDYAYYSQSGTFVGATNGGNTTHIIRPFAEFVRRKDYTISTGVEYQDQSYHQYTSDGLIQNEQKVNWPNTVYTYNRKRLVSKNYNSGFTELMAYKGNSNLIDSITSVDGRSKKYQYDKLFRVISSKESASNITTYYKYDLSNRVTTDSTNYGVYTIVNRKIHDKAGRVIAIQELGVTTNNNRMSVKEYDKYGRTIKEYLPYESPSSSGLIISVPTNHKFTETKYDSSPLSRVLQVIPPDWHPTKYEYGLNVSGDNVSGYTNAGTLTKETVIDANNNRSITFKDFAGRVICQRQSDSTDLASTRKDTYTHYDSFSRVQKVIPPGATATTTPELIYEYTYTVFDQLATKKIPGKGIINYTYNSKRLLAGEKSATMANYIGYKYDAMGRLTQTGLSTATISTPDNPTINTLYTETVFGTTTFLKDKVVTEKTNILGTANMLQTNYAYDTRGRIEQKTYNSHKNLTLNNTVIYTYDNASNLLTASNTINNGSAFSYSQSYTYDHRGRIIDENFTHNSVTKKLSTHEYNFRDELIRLRQGHHTGTTYLQDIDYTYRNNGMLQSMNSPMASNATTGDLFYYELYYDTPIATSGSSAQKNGNIANQRWQRRGATMGMYAYTYDIYNQLTNADYWDYTTSNTLGASTTKYDQTFSYDVRGNLLTQTRRNEAGTQTDNLSYTLLANQNRLARVHDLAANALGHNNNGNSNSGNIYTYDANGNLISDTYRGVTSIDYNHLDLPTLVQRSSTNKLVMIYDARGNLLVRKSYTTSSTIANDSIDYICNIEYVNNVIDQVHHEQGRYKSISAGVYRHEYTIADHLGNTRIVYTDTDSNGVVNHTYDILDENHYYAYGMELPGTFINVAGTNYNYKFNGIERVESFNIDFAFYRGLDPILGRWYQVDPRAELGYNISPYTGMHSNPIYYTDPEGDWINIAIGIVAGATVNVISHWDDITAGGGFNWGAFGKAALIGGGAGAITALTGGSAATAIGLGSTGVASGIVTGGVGSLYGSVFQGVGNAFAFGDEYGFEQLGRDVIQGAFIGGAIGGIAAIFKGQPLWLGNTSKLSPPTKSYAVPKGTNSKGQSFKIVVDEALPSGSQPGSGDFLDVALAKQTGMYNGPLGGAAKGGASIGTKLEYIFGKATGSAHNIERSTGMLKQLESVGIFDNAAGRSLMNSHLESVYSGTKGILQTNGRYLRESLLMGPRGGLKVESIWEGNKLITVKLLGGR